MFGPHVVLFQVRTPLETIPVVTARQPGQTWANLLDGSTPLGPVVALLGGSGFSSFFSAPCSATADNKNGPCRALRRIHIVNNFKAESSRSVCPLLFTHKRAILTCHVLPITFVIFLGWRGIGRFSLCSPKIFGVWRVEMLLYSVASVWICRRYMPVRLN